MQITHSGVRSWACMVLVGLLQALPLNGATPPTSGADDPAETIATVRAICERDGVFTQTNKFDVQGNIGTLDCRGLYEKLGIEIPLTTAAAPDAVCEVPAQSTLDPLEAAVGTLASDVNGAAENAKEAECKKAALENNPKIVSDVACAAAREAIQIGTLGASNFILPMVESLGFKSSCVGSSKSTCIGSAIAGVLKNLVWNITGIWELIKLPVTLTKWAFFSETKKVEDLTSDKMHDASGASDKEVLSFESDPWGWFQAKTKQLWNWITKLITDDFGCQEWEGSALFGSTADTLLGERPEGHKRCIKPWVCFAAATPSQMLNSVCGVLGAIGGEAVTTFLTAGTMDLSVLALKAVHASLKGIEGFKVYRSATQLVEGAVEGIKVGTKATIHGTSVGLKAVDQALSKVWLARFGARMTIGAAMGLPGMALDAALFLTRIPGISHYLRWTGKWFVEGQLAVATRMAEVQVAGKYLQTAGRVDALKDTLHGLTAAGAAARAEEVTRIAEENAAFLDKKAEPSVVSGFINLDQFKKSAVPVFIKSDRGIKLEKLMEEVKQAKRAYAESLADTKKLFAGRWIVQQDAIHLQNLFFEKVSEFDRLAGAKGAFQLIDERMGDALLRQTLKDIEAGTPLAMLKTGTPEVDKRLARWAADYEKAYKRWLKFKPGEVSKGAIQAREAVDAYHAMIDTTLGRTGAFAQVVGAREMRAFENSIRKDFPEKIPGKSPERNLAAKLANETVKKAEDVLRRRGMDYTIEKNKSGNVIIVTEVNAEGVLEARRWDPAREFKSCPGAL